MTTQKNLRELFHDTLKDIYFAEKKILSALPKMAKAAQSEELKEAFQKHENETEGLACTRFRRHRVRCFDGTGGESWKGVSLHASSSLRRCG